MKPSKYNIKEICEFFVGKTYMYENTECVDEKRVVLISSVEETTNYLIKLSGYDYLPNKSISFYFSQEIYESLMEHGECNRGFSVRKII